MASKQDTDYILGAIHKLRNASRGHLFNSSFFYKSASLLVNSNPYIIPIKVNLSAILGMKLHYLKDVIEIFTDHVLGAGNKQSKIFFISI